MKSFVRGFTLIELLVVVAIIGIISAIGIISYTGYVDSAAKKAAENTLRGTAVAQQDYKSSYGTFYPGGSSGTCSPNKTSTDLIITNIYGGVDNLTEQNYFFCSTGDTSSFTLTAKHKTKTCQITLNERNIFTRTNCDN
jgi:prepilin-type N-terminal cleavage/methylation domain-containing protein